MKFVKGDAIAGLIITAINVVGGVTLGIFALEYGVAESLHRFTRLTVGDGLVSQIPALLNSLSAGVIVTRVVRGDECSLISEMGRQVFAQPHVLAIISGVSMLLGIFSSFPLIPFLVVGVIFLIFSVVGESAPQSSSKDSKAFEPQLLSVFSLSLPKSLAQEIENSGGFQVWIEKLRGRFYDHSGLILPVPEIHLSEELKATELSSRGRLLASFAESDRDTLSNALISVLDRNRSELLDDRMTRRILDFYEDQAPEIVNSLVPEQISVTSLTKVFRSVLEAGLSLRRIDTILQCICESLPNTSHDEMIAAIRVSLRHSLCELYATEGEIPCFVLSSDLDLLLWRLNRGDDQADSELVAKLSTQLRVLDGVEVIVCSSGSRKVLETLISNQGLALAVLGFEEIADGFKLDVVGQLDLEAPETGDISRSWVSQREAA